MSIVNETVLNEYLNFYKKLADNKECISTRDIEILDKGGMYYNPLKGRKELDLKGPTIGMCCDNLIPEPFVGNVRYNGEKKVYMIMLNPGFAGTEIDEQIERSDKTEIELFQNVLTKALIRDDDYIWEFDERWRNKAGAKYWFGKINQMDKDKSLLENLKKSWNIEDDVEAINKFSKHFCVIETLPYHSYKYKVNKLVKSLEAFNLNYRFIDEWLIPMAENNDNILLIFGRKKAQDLFTKTLKNIKKDNIVTDNVYFPNLTLGVFKNDGEEKYIGNEIQKFLADVK